MTNARRERRARKRPIAKPTAPAPTSERVATSTLRATDGIGHSRSIDDAVSSEIGVSEADVRHPARPGQGAADVERLRPVHADLERAEAEVEAEHARQR